MFKKKWVLIVFFIFVFNCLYAENKTYKTYIFKSRDNSACSKIINSFSSTYEGDYEIFNLEGKEDKCKKIISKLDLRKNKHKIITVGPEATFTANKMLQIIPIVSCNISEIEYKKIIKYPNITGIINNVPIKNRLETVKLFFPEFVKIGIAYNPKSSSRYFEEAVKISKELSLNIVPLKINSETEVPEILRDINNKIDILLYFPDDLIITKDSIKFILIFTKEQRIPVIGITEEDVKDGVLIAVEPDMDFIGKQIANLIENPSTILNENIKINYPEKNYIILNLRTAKNFGINISPENLKKIDKKYH